MGKNKAEAAKPETEEVPVKGEAPGPETPGTDEAPAVRAEHATQLKELAEQAPKWSVEERAVVLGALKQQEVQDLITGEEFEELAKELGYTSGSLSNLGSLRYLEN